MSSSTLAAPVPGSGRPPRPAPAQAGPRGPRGAHLSLYTELSRQVKEAGLLGRRPGGYALRAAGLAAAFAGATTLLVGLGGTWWQLAVAGLFGALFTQAAFLSHDGAHRQIFTSGKRNEWVSRVLGDLVVGLSYGWWMRKHSRHHANPNTVGKDEDIRPGVIVWTPDEAAGRTGFAAWFAAHQGWLFFPLLTLEGIMLHVGALQTVFGREPLAHRRTEAALLLVRLVGWPVLVVSLLGPGLGAAFLAVQLAVFGVWMGASFAPNHKGMLVLPHDATVDFLRRQVLTSRNIRGGRWVAWAMGGLDSQVEHHLFPSMPSMNLRRARPLVRAYCAAHDVPYTEAGLAQSYGIVVRYLNDVGIGARDPFDCPLAAQMRAVTTR